MLEKAFFNTIIKNNIFNNYRDVIINSSFVNSWVNNYWDNYLGFGPKIIVGWIYLPLKREIIIPWFNFDWHPAKEPYDVGGIPSQSSSTQQSTTTGSSSTSGPQTTTRNTGSLKVNVKHSIFKTPIIDACVVALKDIETDNWYYLHSVGIGGYQNDNLPVGEYFIGAGKEGHTIDCSTVTIEGGEQTTHMLYIKPEESGNSNVESATSLEVLVNQQTSQQSSNPLFVQILQRQMNIR